MAISASMVRDLREQTGAGMMECKKALVECNGDMEKAIELMRKKGMSGADKKASRVAAEGIIAVKVSVDGKMASMVEVNCETDFVAKGDDFQKFANDIAELVLAKDINDIDTLNETEMNGQSVDLCRREIIAKIGENITVRRVCLMKSEDLLAFYKHGTRIGVLVSFVAGGSESLGKDVAMHIAASKPLAVQSADISQELLTKEREIYKAQALESGKPENIVDKIVEGKINKYLSEITLLGQSFVKDPDKNVEQLLKENNASVSDFMRFEVGEGIEKRQENFADEVAAQAAGRT